MREHVNVKVSAGALVIHLYFRWIYAAVFTIINSLNTVFRTEAYNIVGTQ